MIPWFAWLIASVALAIGLLMLWVNYTDTRGINARPTMPDFWRPATEEDMERERRGRELAWKKAKHLKAIREWEAEYYGLLEPEQLIIYNGKEMTLTEADALYYQEQQEIRRRYEEHG